MADGRRATNFSRNPVSKRFLVLPQDSHCENGGSVFGGRPIEWKTCVAAQAAKQDNSNSYETAVGRLESQTKSLTSWVSGARLTDYPISSLTRIGPGTNRGQSSKIAMERRARRGPNWCKTRVSPVF